jgi:O-antigen/teichoic acid export membrane protein
MSETSTIGSRFRLEFLARVVQVIGGSLLIFALARLLEPTGYGLLYFTISVIGSIKIFSKLGIGKSAARYISEYKETNIEQVPHIIKFSLSLNVVCIIIVFVTVLIFHKRLAIILEGPEFIPFLLLGSILLISSPIWYYTKMVCQGFEDIEIAALLRIIESVSNTVLTLGIVLAGFGALGALFGFVLATSIGAGLGIAIIYFYYYRGAIKSSKMEIGLKRRITEYAVPLTATNTATILDKEIDVVLVGMLLNPVAVSYYVIANQIVNFTKAPVSALGFTISPTFKAEKSKGNDRKAANIYENALIHSLGLYIPAATGLILVSNEVVDIVFGAQYMGAVPVLQVLGLYLVLKSITEITSSGLDFLGRARDRAIVKGVTSVMNVGLNIILIPTIGVVGAAIATIITYSIYTILNVYIMSTELLLHKFDLAKDISTIVIISLIMGIVVNYLVDHITGLISLFIVVGIGTTIWAILISVSGVVDLQKIVSKLI